MKHSSGPRKTANLSESTNRQLNKYALAAGAAGVGMLALAQPAEAKIVYTTANVRIQNGSYNLDLNRDGTTDFTISQGNTYKSSCNQRGWLDATAAPHNGVDVYQGYPIALDRGAEIGNGKRFGGGRELMLQS